MMLAQLPDLRRVPDADVDTIQSDFVFGAKTLPVTFSPSAAQPAT